MKNICCTCDKPKATLECGLCKNHICKYCAQFNEGQFTYMKSVPEELSHSTYCVTCFDDKVAAPLAAYNESLAQARSILIFDKTQGKETRFIKRKERPVKVLNCLDEEEATMRLAFLAVEMGYNGVVDVNITSEKVRMGTYQTLKWTGVGIPTEIEERKLMKDRALWQNPN